MICLLRSILFYQQRTSSLSTLYFKLVIFNSLSVFSSVLSNNSVLDCKELISWCLWISWVSSCLIISAYSSPVAVAASASARSEFNFYDTLQHIIPFFIINFLTSLNFSIVCNYNKKKKRKKRRKALYSLFLYLPPFFLYPLFFFF